MSQLPSGLTSRPESFAPSGESTLRLQRAVESLNLNLDDELHRYRQSKAGGGVAPAPRLQLRPNRKPLDLIALKTAAGAAASSTAGPTPPQPLPNPRLQEILGQAAGPVTQSYPPAAVNTAVNQVRLSHGGTLTTYRAAPDDYLKSTEALLDSLPTGSRPVEDTDYAPSLTRRLATPLGVGALLLLLVGSASFGYLITSPQAAAHLASTPLARWLGSEPTPADDSTGLTADGLGTDGIDSSGDGGFEPIGPDLSEQEFSSIDLGRISTLPSSSSTPTVVTTVPAPGPGQASPAPTLESRRPGDPRALGANPSSAVLRADIVTAPRPAVTGTATPSRPAQAAPARPAAPAAAPAPQAPPPALRVAPPAVNAQPPQPLALDRAPAAAPSAAAPRVAPPAPITQAPPRPSYYVVTDYNGAQSLESARGAVGDAYVRNFSSGTRIQMGAFAQESSARSLVEQLQGQGIPAQVISP
ncbi:MAG TPA: SPOR domain-containing protein [Nodosilinea sp.]|nr:SPOR domain-containing protein [Nodosilinea sp.]